MDKSQGNRLNELASAALRSGFDAERNGEDQYNPISTATENPQTLQHDASKNDDTTVTTRNVPAPSASTDSEITTGPALFPSGNGVPVSTVPSDHGADADPSPGPAFIRRPITARGGRRFPQPSQTSKSTENQAQRSLNSIGADRRSLNPYPNYLSHPDGTPVQFHENPAGVAQAIADSNRLLDETNPSRVRPTTVGRETRERFNDENTEHRRTNNRDVDESQKVSPLEMHQGPCRESRSTFPSYQYPPYNGFSPHYPYRPYNAYPPYNEYPYPYAFHPRRPHDNQQPQHESNTPPQTSFSGPNQGLSSQSGSHKFPQTSQGQILPPVYGGFLQNPRGLPSQSPFSIIPQTTYGYNVQPPMENVSQPYGISPQLPPQHSAPVQPGTEQPEEKKKPQRSQNPRKRDGKQGRPPKGDYYCIGCGLNLACPYKVKAHFEPRLPDNPKTWAGPQCLKYDPRYKFYDHPSCKDFYPKRNDKRKNGERLWDERDKIANRRGRVEDAFRCVLTANDSSEAPRLLTTVEKDVAKEGGEGEGGEEEGGEKKDEGKDEGKPNEENEG